METVRQTVDVQMPGSAMTFQTIEECPYPPQEIIDRLRYQPRGIKTADAYYYFYPDGKIEVKAKDGSLKTFWPKPTLRAALEYGKPDGCACCHEKKPGFFQFHADGSVTCNAYGGRYYWSAPFKTQPIGVMESGNRLYPYGDGICGSGWAFHYDDRDIIVDEDCPCCDDDDYWSDSDSYNTYDSDGVPYHYRRYQ